MDPQSPGVTRPFLYACYFRGTGPNAEGYSRLARVLDYSARKYCPNWDIQVEALSPTFDAKRGHWENSNTVKLHRWCAVVDAAPEGQLVLLTDADMAVLAPLDPLIDKPFDFMLTKRPGRLWFNGGVIGVRASAPVRRFMHAWADLNQRFFDRPLEHAPWRRQFGGINQASLGKLWPEIATTYGLDVCLLPGREWNCEQMGWASYQAGPLRLLHVKSALRRAVLYDQTYRGRIRPGRLDRRGRRGPAVAPAPSLALAIPALAQKWATLERELTQGATT